MNGTHLIKNLNWLNRAEWMMTAGELDDDGSKDGNDVVVGEDDEPSGSGSSSRINSRRLVGGGSSSLKKRSEWELRRVLTDMANMLNNWTLHRQNLGSMLANYHMQGRHMKKNLGMNWNISLI